MVRRAHRKGLGPIDFIVKGREKDHGDELGFRIGLQFKTGHVAVDLRHHHVHQNQIRLPAEGFRDSLLAVRGHVDRIACPGQNLFEQIQNIRIVINAQDGNIIGLFWKHFASLQSVKPERAAHCQEERMVRLHNDPEIKIFS